MERQEVESSNIVSVGFEKGVLEVEFKGGSIYIYRGISNEVYNEFMEADSKGGFLARRIRGKYKCEKAG